MRAKRQPQNPLSHQPNGLSKFALSTKHHSIRSASSQNTRVVHSCSGRTFNHAVSWMLVSGCVQHRDVARLVRALRFPAHLAREVLLDHVAAVCKFDARPVAALAYTLRSRDYQWQNNARSLNGEIYVHETGRGDNADQDFCRSGRRIPLAAQGRTRRGTLPFGSVA